MTPSSPGDLQKHGSIIVVDDDPDVRAVLQRFLVRNGYRVQSVGSAKECLALLQAQHYDLVITDLRMPGGSGLDLIAKIRSSEADTGTILISGRAEVTDASRAFEEGVAGLLQKPFPMEELQAAVERALSEQRARRDAVENGRTLPTPELRKDDI